jgi:CelD/BcsL family acetyltransferase involved in cellulose biosynthesis
MDAAARSMTSLDLEDFAEAEAPAQAGDATTMAPLELTLVTERSAFDALEHDWNDLFARAGKPTHVFQTFNFCWHWANHYLASSEAGAPNLSLAIVTGRRDGHLIMLWPLIAERRLGLTQIVWMGDPVGQYGDALIDAGPDAPAVLRAGLDLLIKKMKPDVLRLRRVRGDANIRAVMDTIGARIADRLTAPFMDLASAKDFETFEQRYSSKTRKNRRRLARRLEEKGPVEFLRLHGGKEARNLAIEAIALKASWLKDRGLLSNAIADEKMSCLFADLAEGKKRPVDCIVSALKVAGETAALEVSFVSKRRLAMHLIAFNLEYEKSGAGVLLLEQSLKDGYVEKLDVYDMLAPGDNYKLDWCDQSDAVFDWVKPVSAKGHLYARVYLGFLRRHIKTAMKSMPQPLRRLLAEGYVRTTAGA